VNLVGFIIIIRRRRISENLNLYQHHINLIFCNLCFILDVSALS